MSAFKLFLSILCPCILLFAAHSNAVSYPVKEHALNTQPFDEIEAALVRQINNTDDPLKKVDFQYSLAALYFQFERINLLRNVLDQISYNDSTDNHSEASIFWHMYKGYSYSRLAQYETAAEYYDKAIEHLNMLANATPNKMLELRLMLEMYSASNLAFLQNYSVAIEILSNLKATADHNDFSLLSGVILYLLADLTYELKNYEQAQEYFRESHLRFPDEASHYIAKSKMREAQMINIVGDRARAFALLDEATKTLLTIKDTTALSYAYVLKSYFHSKAKNPVAALEWIRKSVVLREQLGNSSDISNGYVHYSAVLAENGQLALALEYAERAIPLLDNTSDLAGKWDAFHNYGALLYENGEYQQAYDYMLKAERALLEKARLDITTESARLTSQFNLQQEQLKNRFLDEKNTLLKTQLAQEKQLLARQSWAIIALLAFSVVIAALLLWIYKLYLNNKQLAGNDPLTKLPNRRSIIERGEQTFQSSKRYQQDLCVLMIDIDFFKAINDTYGHAVGDKVLIFIASVFKSVIRNTDFVGRVGGEEFLIILPNSSHDDAEQLMKRLFNQLSIQFAASNLGIENVTFSIGLACNNSDFEHFSDLAKAADIALYHAKNKGRNQGQSFHQGMNFHKSVS